MNIRRKSLRISMCCNELIVLTEISWTICLRQKNKLQTKKKIHFKTMTDVNDGLFLLSVTGFKITKCPAKLQNYGNSTGTRVLSVSYPHIESRDLTCVPSPTALVKCLTRQALKKHIGLQFLLEKHMTCVCLLLFSFHSNLSCALSLYPHLCLTS